MQDAGQVAVNTAKDAADAGASGTKNVVDAVVKGAQDVVSFVATESRTRATAAGTQAGQLEHAARDSLTAGAQGAVAAAQDTFKQGGAAAGQQAANAGAARNEARANVAAGANLAADAAVAALKAATDPIVREMTALMTQIRNNPPATEAAFRQAEAALGQLVQRLNAASELAMSAHVGLVQSDAFQRALALQDAALLSFWGYMQALSPYAAEEMSGTDARLIRNVTTNHEETTRRQLALGLLGSPEGRRRMEMIGISAAELAQIAAYGGTSIDGSNVMNFVIANVLDPAASQASNELSIFFAEAQRSAAAARQRAELEAARAAERLANEKIIEMQEHLRTILGQLQAPPSNEEARRAALERIRGVLALYLNEEKAQQVNEYSEGTWRTLRGTARILIAILDAVLATSMNIYGGIGTALATGMVNVISAVVSAVAESPDRAAQYLPTLESMAAGRTSIVDGMRNLSGLLVDAGRITQAQGDALLQEFVGQGGSQEQANQSKQSSESTSVEVWSGEVEVMGKGSVKAGQMLLGNTRASLNLYPLLLASAAPRPDQVKVDSDLFRDTGKPVAEGLYVWVRDGEVSLTKDGKTVDVAKGNAAVATRDKIELLDAVPNFMRFDPTPVPTLVLDAAVDAFRLPDGALLGMCRVR